MKKCNKCHVLKPFSDYSRKAASPDGFGYTCRPCDSARQKAYRETHREKARQTAKAWMARGDNRAKTAARCRDWHLRKKFGISAAEWDTLFEAQGRKCAICRRETPTGNNWHTDHCHATNTVRGILCYHCNLAAGYVKDSPEVALQLYSYLGGRLPFAA